MGTDAYQTYVFTLSVWALNILIMIIGLTLLLIRDPIIYSDSEIYQDYKQLRKQAEENLFNVNKKKTICMFYFYYSKLVFNCFREIRK